MSLRKPQSPIATQSPHTLELRGETQPSMEISNQSGSSGISPRLLPTALNLRLKEVCLWLWWINDFHFRTLGPRQAQCPHLSAWKQFSLTGLITAAFVGVDHWQQLHRPVGGRTARITYQCEASSYTNFSLWFYDYISREESSNRIQFQLKAKTPCYLSHNSTNQGLQAGSGI